MRAYPAFPLALSLLLMAPLAGCLGVDNMPEFREALGFHRAREALGLVPEARAALPPVASIESSASVARVGETVRFWASAVDPQSLPLVHTWDFADGQASAGERTSHAWSAPGPYVVTLSSRNSAGLTSVAQVEIRVVANAAPTIDALVVERGGAKTHEALAGELLDLRVLAADADGDSLSVAWDLGDGRSGSGPRVTHAYAAGGVYAVRVTVSDPYGASASATAELRIHFEETVAGRMGHADPPARHVFPVAAGATSLSVALSFPASGGVNDLDLALVDASGQRVAQAKTPTAAGELGLANEWIGLNAAALAGRAPGPWALLVERTGGLDVAYELAVSLRY